MKQIIFLLFLTPSLCFAQLGINVANPEATLHIKPKGDLPSLTIENIDNKSFEEQRSYNKLIIDDNGIVKQQDIKTDVSKKSRKIYRYYLKNNLRLGGNVTSSKSKGELPLITFDPETELYENNAIKFPKTGRFGVIIRIHALLDYKNISTPNKELFPRNTANDYSAGILNIHIGPYPNYTSTDQDSKSMQFQISPFDNKMYINVIFEASGEKGKPLYLGFLLNRNSWSKWFWNFHNHYESTNVFNENGPIVILGHGDNTSNPNVLHETTNITMWELN